MIDIGFNADKLYPIHNSLAYDQQLKARNIIKPSSIYYEHFGNFNPNLFFVGRLTPVKKLGQVLEALLICNKHGKRYNFTFIGSGTDFSNLQAKTKQLDLTSQVWFYGPCYDEIQLSSLIYNADLCVAPGNIGLTAMHSMVFGTPCITHSDFPYQMPEFEAIKEGQTGTFFLRNDIENLSLKIEEWFDGPGRNRETIRKACMDVIDKEWNPYYQIDILKNGLGL